MILYSDMQGHLLDSPCTSTGGAETAVGAKTSTGVVISRFNQSNIRCLPNMRSDNAGKKSGLALTDSDEDNGQYGGKPVTSFYPALVKNTETEQYVNVSIYRFCITTLLYSILPPSPRITRIASNRVFCWRFQSTQRSSHTKVGRAAKRQENQGVSQQDAVRRGVNVAVSSAY